MTNGEKFKEVFGLSQVDEGVLYAYAWLSNYNAAEFSIDWWNAEYKAKDFLSKFNKIIKTITPQEPTTKNNLGVETTQMIDKSNFSQEQYKSDLQSAYDCGYAQAKNDLGVEDGERELALMYLEQIKEDYIEGVGYERHPLPEYYAIETAIKSLALPSATPQEPQSFKWCTDCKEYDQEKHCCHRYSKVIRDTVAEIRQEPVLDNIRSDIKAYTDSQGFINISEYRFNEILDKYKTDRGK